MNNKPIYRKDGQIANLGALPYPGHRGLTLRQFELQFDDLRPEPKNSASKMDIVDRSSKYFVLLPTDLSPEELAVNVLLKLKDPFPE